MLHAIGIQHVVEKSKILLMQTPVQITEHKHTSLQNHHIAAGLPGSAIQKHIVYVVHITQKCMPECEKNGIDPVLRGIRTHKH